MRLLITGGSGCLGSELDSARAQSLLTTRLRGVREMVG